MTPETLESAYSFLKTAWAFAKKHRTAAAVAGAVIILAGAAYFAFKSKTVEKPWVLNNLTDEAAREIGRAVRMIDAIDSRVKEEIKEHEKIEIPDNRVLDIIDGLINRRGGR